MSTSYVDAASAKPIAQPDEVAVGSSAPTIARPAGRPSSGSGIPGYKSSRLSFSASRSPKSHSLVTTAVTSRSSPPAARMTCSAGSWGTLLIGLSYGWWIGKHNRHHANPNKEHHDPDIGDGVLAFTTEQVASRTGRLGRLITRRQAWLFFPLLTLEGLNLHFESVRSLRRHCDRSGRGGHPHIELLMLAAHMSAYLLGLLLVMSPLKALTFIAIHQAVWGLYMGCSFAPNHKGMPIIGAHQKLDYLRRQVLTSRNVRGGWITDLLLGGLNYQIEHHLFR